MKKRTKAFLGIIISIALVIILGITNIIPYFAVIPDMVKVGIDYISLDKNKNSVSKTELKNKLDSIEIEHPFILANDENFETVRTEARNNSFSPYTKSLYLSAISNADALLDTDIVFASLGALISWRHFPENVSLAVRLFSFQGSNP